MAKTTKALPSFRRLSDSIKLESFFGAPRDFKRLTTATGSVAETILPNKTD